MARKRVEPLPELHDDSPPEAIEIDAGVTDLLIQLGDTPAEAKVHLYRMRPGVRPPFAFLDEMTAGDFNIADVKARYGGGEFLVRVWQRGVPGFKINQRFSIEGEPRAAVQPAPAAAQATMIPSTSPGAAPIIVPPGDNGAAMAAMIRAMQDGFAQLARMMQSAPRGNSIQETLQLAMLVKQLMGGGSQGNPLEIMKDVLGIVREAQPITGEGGKADGWSLLQSVAEKVLPALIERTAMPGGALDALPPELALTPPAVAPLPPNPASVTPAGPMFTPTPPPFAATPPVGAASPIASAQPTPQSYNGGNTMQAQFARALQFLAVQAANGAEPDAYAQLALDAVDADTLLAFVHRPDWYSEVCKLAPAAARNAEWWNKLRDLLIQALADDTENDPPESPEAVHFGPMQ